MLEALAENPELLGLLEKGEVVHMSAADGDGVEIGESVSHLKRTQLNYLGDKTLAGADPGGVATGGYQIDGVNRFIVVETDLKTFHPNYEGKSWDFHYDTKTQKKAWDFIQKYNNIGGENKDKPHTFKLDGGEYIDSEIEGIESEYEKIQNESA
jgi:hypothetical protein